MSMVITGGTVVTAEGTLEADVLVEGEKITALFAPDAAGNVSADEEIDATAADPDLAEMLGLSKGAAILRIRQVIYSTKGKATIYVVGYYRSERRLQLGLATRSPASLLRRQLAESDISLDDSTVYLSANAVLEWPIHIATGPYRTLVSNATGNPSVVPFPPIEAADTLGR